MEVEVVEDVRGSDGFVAVGMGGLFGAAVEIEVEGCDGGLEEELAAAGGAFGVCGVGVVLLRCI